MSLGEQLFLAWLCGAISMSILIAIHEAIRPKEKKKPYDWRKDGV
jgi:hypothetical protein